MTPDLDSLATALYVKTDDLLKESPCLAPWRAVVGIPPRLTDAELFTLAVTQALLGFTSERRWICHAQAHLRHLFPYLPGQSGYNRCLRKATDLIAQVVNRLLATDTSLWTDTVWVVDSTPAECGRSRETAKRSDLAGWDAPARRPTNGRPCSTCSTPSRRYDRSSSPSTRPSRPNSTSNATRAGRRAGGGLVVCGWGWGCAPLAKNRITGIFLLVRIGVQFLMRQLACGRRELFR